MRTFGLIGFPLTHSFSKKYFSEKFTELGIADSHAYDLFECTDASYFLELFQTNAHLVGLNVTIPHKLAVIPYLDELDTSAECLYLSRSRYSSLSCSVELLCTHNGNFLVLPILSYTRKEKGKEK